MKCLQCDNLTTNPKFCSKSCAARRNNRGVRRHGDQPSCCLQCNQQLRTSKKKYCSNVCRWQHEYERYIVQWKQGFETGSTKKGVANPVRRYLHEQSDSKCWKCGWSKIHPITGNVPLQIHHADGNSTNNQEENLQLLCPNCHSLTSTWGILNKGHGRKVF